MNVETFPSKDSDGEEVFKLNLLLQIWSAEEVCEQANTIFELEQIRHS